MDRITFWKEHGPSTANLMAFDENKGMVPRAHREQNSLVLAKSS
jgi:hypothetical protein